jgi:polyisoprenoid-binding protein YceI
MRGTVRPMQTQRNTNLRRWASRALLVGTIGALGLSTAACEDPAKDVPKATVGSAKPVASTAASPSASPSAAAQQSAAPTAAPVAAAPTKPAGAIDISNDGSKLEFVGSKVTAKHEGKFEKWSGWIALDGDKPEGGKAYIEIDTSTVATEDEKLNGHLKSADFFDIEKFPKATFVITEIKAGGDGGATHTVSGNLTLHGVEKGISFPATIKADASSVTAKAEFAINRKDFGIVYAGKADNLIRDDVVIKLDIAAKRSK